MTLQDVQDKLDWEGGYEYFHGGSNFEEVEDPHFHELREAFVSAWDRLEAYMEANTGVTDTDGQP